MFHWAPYSRLLAHDVDVDTSSDNSQWLHAAERDTTSLTDFSVCRLLNIGQHATLERTTPEAPQSLYMQCQYVCFSCLLDESHSDAAFLIINNIMMCVKQLGCYGKVIFTRRKWCHVGKINCHNMVTKMFQFIQKIMIFFPVFWY